MNKGEWGLQMDWAYDQLAREGVRQGTKQAEEVIEQ